MSSKIIMSSSNEDDTLYAVFERSDAVAWLYLCTSKADKKDSSGIIGDVFVCNTVRLIEHTELDHYKPNLPPITTGFGLPEAVCADIDKVQWELIWLANESILLVKNQNPWALISQGEKRGMCKSIKKNGPWGNNWNEKKYKKICR